MQKIKSWFTLVEMLIVVVIIGILSAALLPRLTGSIKETRDLKRQTDLRNIAAAVEMYKNAKGKFPFVEEDETPYKIDKKVFEFYRKASDLAPLLSPYISEIPKDPNKNSLVDIAGEYWAQKSWGTHCLNGLQPWEYLYTLQLKRNAATPLEAGQPVVLLVAKTETPDFANYVVINKLNPRPCSWCSLWCWYSQWPDVHPARLGTGFDLCSSVEKWETGQRIKQSDGSYHCTYTNPEQLYHIVKIEW